MNDELWKRWRAYVAERFEWEAEELAVGGGSPLFNEDQRDIAAQTWRNAANKIRTMPTPDA